MSDRQRYIESRDLIDAARCLRCGKEYPNADRGGWSVCFTFCEDCWTEVPLGESAKTPEPSSTKSAVKNVGAEGKQSQ